MSASTRKGLLEALAKRVVEAHADEDTHGDDEAMVSEFGHAGCFYDFRLFEAFFGPFDAHALLSRSKKEPCDWRASTANQRFLPRPIHPGLGARVDRLRGLPGHGENHPIVVVVTFWMVQCAVIAPACD